MENIRVTLMNKNTPVIDATVTNVSIRHDTNTPELMFTSMTYLNRKLAPLVVFLDGQEGLTQLNRWFQKRLFSNKRTDFPKREDIKWNGVPHFFSFSDQYWIRYTENETWEDLNFFTNNFSKRCGDVIFSKNLYNIENLSIDYDSPELTTNGVLKKRWDKEGIRSFLIKHMSEEFSQEPLSEILATKLLSKIHFIQFVPYKLCIEGYDLCSQCNNFVTPNVEFVPAVALYAATKIHDEEKELPEAERIYAHLQFAIKEHEIPNAENFIDSIIIADRYILNYDRHLGNFGFLRDVETGKFIGPAPLFDFGNAFAGYNEGLVSNCFAAREDYLFKNQKFKPLDEQIVQEFKDEINKSVLLKDEQKRQMIKNIELNNRYIRLNLDEDFRNKSQQEREKIVQSVEVEW